MEYGHLTAFLFSNQSSVARLLFQAPSLASIESERKRQVLGSILSRSNAQVGDFTMTLIAYWGALGQGDQPGFSQVRPGGGKIENWSVGVNIMRLFFHLLLPGSLKSCPSQNKTFMGILSLNASSHPIDLV